MVLMLMLDVFDVDASPSLVLDVEVDVNAYDDAVVDILYLMLADWWCLMWPLMLMLMLMCLMLLLVLVE